MVNLTRRLLPILFSGLLLVPLASTVAAEDIPPPPADDAALLQDGTDLVNMTNAKRASLGLVDLRMDAALMSIARDRARVMAANDVMSHTEPDGTKVWDRMNAAGITWYAAWRDHRLEPLPGRVLDGRGDPSLVGVARPPRDHGLDRLQLRRLRGGRLRGRQVLLRRCLRQDARSHGPVGEVRDASPCGRVDATHKRVTVRWGGGDTRLQVLTSGLRYFQVIWRRQGGAWHVGTPTTATTKSITLTPRGPVRIPDPVARPGRQLVGLATISRPSLTRAPSRRHPGRRPEARPRQLI